MFRKILITSMAVLGLLVLGVVALFFWRDRVIAQRSQNALQLVENALTSDLPRKALAMINSRPPAGRSEEDELRWLAAEVEASARLGLVGRLQTLYRQNSVVTLANEDAALLLARGFLHGGDEEAGREIATGWEAHSPRPHLWFVYRVDAALLAGRRDRALELLQARQFDGPEDSVRLSRLALLTGSTNLAAAWNQLAAAYEANPRDADVRSFRAQILEAMGSNRLARVEYVAAHLANPANPLMRDQLAEFYRRRGSYENAFATWRPALTNSPPAYIPLKTWFWGRVVRSTGLPASNHSAVDPLGNLLSYVEALPARSFWNADDFSLVPNANLFERERQEVFWLRVLERLRSRELDSAADLVRANPFRGRAYDAGLDRVLHAVLSWRKHGRFAPYDVEFPAGEVSATRHSLLVEIDRLARLERRVGRAVEVPAEMRRLLERDDVFGLVFLAAGWLRAGLDLLATEQWSTDVPTWVPYTVTQARRIVHGAAAALNYGTNQPSSPALRLLLGELRIATGEVDGGLSELLSLSRRNDAVGYRAAWLAANAALEKRDHGRVREIVDGQPRLGAVGQELLAKSALMQGQTNRAEEVYRGIAETSVEAKAYLARLAFARKNWKAARELTEALLLNMPDELVLRRNLERIVAAEAGGGPR